ncbi:MAG: hypothetical protein IJW82_06335 [Clostridia bacterium]|nr:hypothetical protein [Clostridia bacterium]
MENTLENNVDLEILNSESQNVNDNLNNSKNDIVEEKKDTIIEKTPEPKQSKKTENIFYFDARGKIKDFFQNEFDTCPPKLMNRFLNFFNNILIYEEEGRKLQPRLLFTSNVEIIAKNIPSTEKHTMFVDDDELYFEKRMKALIPFTEDDWWVFISTKDNKIAYGIIKTLTNISDPTFKESLLTCEKLSTRKDNFDLIMVEKYSDFIISFTSVTNAIVHKLNVNFTIDEHVNSTDAGTEIDKFIEACFLKYKPKSKTSLSNAKFLLKKTMTRAIRKVHGTICVIVDKNYADNKFFSDGVWLKEPINMAKIFSSTGSNSELKQKSCVELFLSMLNSDGITILDNSGKLRAYGVFVETNMEKTKNVAGGARKRAAYTVINCRRTKIAGVYFQSQEGEIIYSDVKGYKSSMKSSEEKAKAKKLKEEKAKEETLKEETIKEETINLEETTTNTNEIFEADTTYTDTETQE